MFSTNLHMNTEQQTNRTEPKNNNNDVEMFKMKTKKNYNWLAPTILCARLWHREHIQHTWKLFTCKIHLNTIEICEWTKNINNTTKRIQKHPPIQLHHNALMPIENRLHDTHQIQLTPPNTHPHTHTHIYAQHKNLSRHITHYHLLRQMPIAHDNERVPNRNKQIKTNAKTIANDSRIHDARHSIQMEWRAEFSWCFVRSVVATV